MLCYVKAWKIEVLNLQKGKKKKGGSEAGGWADHDQKMGFTVGGVERNVAGDWFQPEMAMHNGISDCLWHNLTF